MRILVSPHKGDVIVATVPRTKRGSMTKYVTFEIDNVHVWLDEAQTHELVEQLQVALRMLELARKIRAKGGQP